MKSFFLVLLLPVLAFAAPKPKRVKLHPPCKIVVYKGVKYWACPDKNDSCEFILTEVKKPAKKKDFVSDD